MTEAEWNNCTDPQAMLHFLRVSGRASDRKLCLFACACVRRLWTLLTDERSRRAVEVAEREVDGRLDSPAAAEARREAHDAAGELNQRVARLGSATERRWGKVEAVAASAAAAVLQQSAVWLAARGAAFSASVAIKLAARARGAAGRPSAKKERAVQCLFLRDIFPPTLFRSMQGIDSAWLGWNGGTVVKLAQAAYDERASEQMSILADALEDAGCDNEEVLTHCRRQRAVHVRGCFVLDLLLGKE
jgi:hypothetical protein